MQIYGFFSLLGLQTSCLVILLHMEDGVSLPLLLVGHLMLPNFIRFLETAIKIE